jgi:hypothetical protein
VKSFFGHLSTPSERTVGMAWHGMSVRPLLLRMILDMMAAAAAAAATVLFTHARKGERGCSSSSSSSTGNGLVVPSSSHKREVAGSIPAGCTKTILFPHPLLPHRLMSHFDVWRHLTFHKNPHKTSQQQDSSSTRPRGEKKVLPLQSTGEERKEENNSTVQLVNCQYWYKL